MLRSLEPVATILAKTSQPLAQAYITASLQAAQYLHSVVPRNPNPPQPFERDNWKPTETQKKELADAIEVANNPLVVLDHVAKGTLSRAHAAASANMYPSLHIKRNDKIQEVAFSHDAPKVSYGQRLQLSTLTGGHLDPSLKNLAAIQSSINTPMSSSPNPAPISHHKGANKAAMSHTPSLQTDVQRRSYGSYGKS